MRINDCASPEGGVQIGADAELKDIVMGLHWDPPQGDAGADPADLDAWCVLFDAQGSVLEVIHPGRLRGADGSVIHTGDSRNGASQWDDERIFVFLAALPEAVSRLAFFVASATGRAFDEIRGAYCHVSDRDSERERLRLELTALAGCTVHRVATVQRVAAGWNMSTDPHAVPADLRALLKGAKRSGAASQG